MLLLHHLKHAVENCLNVNPNIVQAFDTPPPLHTNSNPPLFVLFLCFARQFICRGVIIVPDKEVTKKRKNSEVESNSNKNPQDESRFKWPLKLGVKS